MKTVRDLLRGKGDQVWSIAPEATLYEALALMASKDVGALLVLEGGQLAGIVSERDYARKVDLHGRTSRDTHVREIMTERVVSVGLADTIDRCMALMTEHHIRHLPVLEAGRLVGLVSIGDVVKGIITEQEFVIAELEKYIAGER